MEKCQHEYCQEKTIMYIHLVQNTLEQEALFLPAPEIHGNVLLPAEK